MTARSKVTCILVIAALVLPVIVSARTATGKTEVLREAAVFDLIPCGIRTYRSTEVLKLDPSMLEPQSSSETGRSGLYGFSLSKEQGRTYRKGKFVPIVLSVLVPGAGEIYMGYYKRGAALIAMEATAWLGYRYYHRKGLDSREVYQNYADAHWSVTKWYTDHPSGPYNSVDEIEAVGSSGAWVLDMFGDWSDAFFYMPFVPKEKDGQEYYENLGKYNWFISGWDDWDSTLDPLGYIRESTDHRTYYRTLRNKSNDQLTNADRFIYLSILARAYSIVETIILSRRGDDDDGAGSRLRFKAESYSLHSSRFLLEFRFK